jgi:hypothetical protein
MGRPFASGGTIRKQRKWRWQDCWSLAAGVRMGILFALREQSISQGRTIATLLPLCPDYKIRSYGQANDRSQNQELIGWADELRADCLTVSQNNFSGNRAVGNLLVAKSLS